jgi:hypothetical protein
MIVETDLSPQKAVVCTMTLLVYLASSIVLAVRCFLLASIRLGAGSGRSHSY